VREEEDARAKKCRLSRENDEVEKVSEHYLHAKEGCPIFKSLEEGAPLHMIRSRAR